MAYCPHCSFMMPMTGTKVSCPNCGRTRVKLTNRKPVFSSSNSAHELKESSKGTFFSSLVAAVTIAIFSIIFLSLGLMMRSPIGALWILIGILSGSVSLYCVMEMRQNFQLNSKPQMGFIDHLRDLAISREALQQKIADLEKLIQRQNAADSDRAANRLKLIQAALDNRLKKLSLVNEMELIIETKRRISRLSALAQDLSERSDFERTEKEIDSAFGEISDWLKELPAEFQSEAGKSMKRSVAEAMGLHSEIMEQIEDRRVMRVLDDGDTTDEAMALARINMFLDRSALDTEMETLEMKEVVAADEEFIRINTEIRLLKDGIKDGPNLDFSSEDN